MFLGQRGICVRDEDTIRILYIHAIPNKRFSHVTYLNRMYPNKISSDIPNIFFVRERSVPLFDKRASCKPEQ